MGKLMGMLGSVFIYLCVGTVVSALAGFVYLRATGKLDNGRIERVLAAARGAELGGENAKSGKTAAAGTDTGQSIEEQRKQRDLQTRNVEMRERIISDLVDNMKASRAAIEKTSNTIKTLVEASQKDLDEKKEKAKNQGIKKFRTFLENNDAKQDKDLIVNMIKRGDDSELETAVATWTSLSPSKQVEIAAEFVGPAELDILDQILSRIRRGEPDTSIINQTKDKLSQ